MFLDRCRLVELQPTILVDDAFMRLTGGGKFDWKDRAHFFCAAARVMRHWVIDYARSRNTQKRGRAKPCVPLASQPEPSARQTTTPERFLELDEALQRLEQKLPAASEVFHLRHFLECTPLEIAGILGIEPRAVHDRWKQALKFLQGEMGEWPEK